MSNSAAALMMGGIPTIAPIAEGTSVGGKAFPSLAFTKEGTLLVGERTRRQAVSNPEGTIMAIKRSMYADRMVEVYGKEFAPRQVYSLVFQKAEFDAEGFLGEQVTKAVITITACFNDNQRQATKDAEQFADADKQKKEEAGIRNQADNMLYTVEKTKSELKDKIPQDLLTKLDNSSKELKESLDEKDIEKIKGRTEALTNVLKEVGTIAYRLTLASQESSSGQSDRTDSTVREVVDAEYKVNQAQDERRS